jgi:hypothetical protein
MEVLQYLQNHPGLTSYQLDRHILGAHGPETLSAVRSELVRFGLAEPILEGDWERWRITTKGERATRGSEPRVAQ